MKKLSAIVVTGLMICASAMAGSYVDTVTTSVTNIPVVINMTNMVQAAGSDIAWKPGLIMLRCYDSPTGNVLKVEHVRANVTRGTNTVTVENTIYLFATTTAQTSVVWAPPADYIAGTANESIRVSSSSTNAVISINREIAR